MRVRGTFKGINFGTVQAFQHGLSLEKLMVGQNGQIKNVEGKISDGQSENVWSKLLFFSKYTV